MGHVAWQNEAGARNVLDVVENSLETIYHVQLLDFEPSQLLQTAAFALSFIERLKQVCNRPTKVLLLEADQTGVKLEFKRFELPVELVEDFLALVRK